MPKTSYMGNGSSTEFTFNFPYYENTDIIVTKNCSTATGYTIVGTSAGLNADIPYTGGKVVFDTAPTATDSITISRSLPLTRCVDYQPTERLNPTILNQDFNYLMEVIKDRKDELDTLVAQYSDIANKESTENLITKINTVTETINDFDNEIENGKIMSKNDFYSYTTNCITEIPQDIKLELNNGTLTLKAGSKIYIPNGSNVFTVINIANDLTVTDTSNRTLFIGVNTTGTALLKCVGSETGTPVTGTYKYYYDSTANKCYQSGASSYTQVTFPIAIVTATSDGGIVSIDRIFNGFGYIGSTFFVLPGLTALAPSGRNADGSLKDTKCLTTSVQILNSESSWTFAGQLMLRPNGTIGAYSVAYNPQENYYKYQNQNAILCLLADVAFSSGVITKFNSKQTLRVVDYNSAVQFMPNYTAGTEIQKATTTSGSYTAPQSGQLMVSIMAGTGSTTFKINNVAVGTQKSTTSGTFGVDYNVFVKSGDVVEWTCSGNALMYAYFYPFKNV